jgi:hypothetical protein
MGVQKKIQLKKNWNQITIFIILQSVLTSSGFMRYTTGILFTSCIVLLLLLAGCADVNVTKKVGDFGTAFGASSDEQKAIDWFKTTYGDPLTNNDQPARFVEPLITTGLDANKLPVNKVTTFPQSGGSVYFFVIYDNFKKGDQITVSWTYLENGKEVTSVQQQAGGDFGRFIVEFQKPDTGWGKGKQRIMVTGDGATSSVDFEIGDALKTTPLPYNAGSTGSSGASTTIPARVTSGKINAQIAKLNGGQRIGSQAFGHVVVDTTTAPVTTAANAGPDLKNDVNNCGKAGNRCIVPPNTAAYCWQGQCTYDCIDNFRYCGIPNAPPETSVGCVAMFGDNNHCGNCDTKCVAGQYCNHNHCEATPDLLQANKDQSEGTGSSSGSQMGLAAGSCPSGETSCKGQCVDLDSDSNNCGVCGFPCPPGLGCKASLCLSLDVCRGFPCPPLTACAVWNGLPVCKPTF